jgi:hypothetical protein
MNQSDEQLLHRFYAGETDLVYELAQRYDPILRLVAHQILALRTGSVVQASGEWDVQERLTAVWVNVLNSAKVNVGRWPHERISALNWLIYLLCVEMDRHLGLRPPY